MTLDLLVLADDRTGALETAGACADAGLTVVMTPFGTADVLPPHDCRVIDLGTRRLSADEAARRAASVRIDATRHAHKIDSTLQGNWAAEIASRALPTLLVPAFPSAGRTCVDGVVHVHGAAVGRPGDQLPDATVCDATSDRDLDRHAQTWLKTPDLLLAGTAGAIGAGARALGRTTDRRVPRARGRVLVVCGSRQPIALAQAAAIARHHDVVYTPVDPTGDVLVIIGGDTAAAVLGDRAMVVGGTIEPGVAWSHVANGTGPLVITKPGGFGDEQTLVRVLQAILHA